MHDRAAVVPQEATAAEDPREANAGGEPEPVAVLVLALFSVTVTQRFSPLLFLAACVRAAADRHPSVPVCPVVKGEAAPAPLPQVVVVEAEAAPAPLHQVVMVEAEAAPAPLPQGGAAGYKEGGSSGEHPPGSLSAARTAPAEGVSLGAGSSYADSIASSSSLATGNIAALEPLEVPVLGPGI
ncbi:UNVERIFIED_CONTAM: hypothetical protein FKN15_053831 [Acipenser sinensis]